MIRAYIGYDQREDAGFQVCRDSMLRHASEPVNIIRLDQQWLRDIGLYRRNAYRQGEQWFDTIDDKPFSTEFSFTRFLVPSLQPDGWALFCDSDFLWRADVAELMAHADDRFAVMVVKHKFQPKDTSKMRGQAQQQYPRKNWSSLILWNCSHPNRLTPFEANTRYGSWLHGFRWLEEGQIGRLNECWNWLEGHSPKEGMKKAVHFTRGTPDMPGWENVEFADEWMRYWSERQS